jgi:hypothetical protein
MSFLVLGRIVLLHKTEFNMPITLLPSLILLYISKVVAPVASRMDPRYLDLLILNLKY